MLIINIFSIILLRKLKTLKTKTNKKKAHYLAHTKSGSCLRKARVPEYQLHAILMYIFMISFKRMILNLSTESYGFLKKSKLFFVSKSVAVK